jgi:hypothetical protein
MIQKKDLGILAAGIIIGILIAPSKGCKTRKKIGCMIGALTEYVRDNFLNSNAEEWLYEPLEEQIDIEERAIA